MLFKQYILWGFTYKILSELSGFSVRHLIRIFHKRLEHKPPSEPVKQELTDEAYLLVDGLWLKRWYVMMVYRQHKNLAILYLSIAGREAKTTIVRDLLHIQRLGYRFSGIISDGGKSVVSAIKEVFPNTPHQICLAHMHREATNALGKKPKDPRIKELKKLADHVWLIESKEALNWWSKKRDEWIYQNLLYLRERRYDITGHWWYIHKGVRKTVRILETVSKVSFTFLDHPLIPKTTNELEAQFGHLGRRWLTHRGLRTYRWENFMKWFVYFYNQEKLSDNRRKKA